MSQEQENLPNENNNETNSSKYSDPANFSPEDKPSMYQSLCQNDSHNDQEENNANGDQKEDSREQEQPEENEPKQENKILDELQEPEEQKQEKEDSDKPESDKQEEEKPEEPKEEPKQQKQKNAQEKLNATMPLQDEQKKEVEDKRLSQSVLHDKKGKSIPIDVELSKDNVIIIENKKKNQKNEANGGNINKSVSHEDEDGNVVVDHDEDEKNGKIDHEVIGDFDEDQISYPKKKKDNAMEHSQLSSVSSNPMRISKTIETQTNDLEFPSSIVTKIESDIEISIPETKQIKDGMIYTYSLYKVVATMKESEDNASFVVYRRYNDFYWLFENMASKYYGYIIPIPPSKNILTTVNQEGLEFAEKRKKELIIFLKKCLSNKFLRTVPELNMFLSDDTGFFNFKKKEENLKQNIRDKNLFEKIQKFVQQATKPTQANMHELNTTESELYNYQVLFQNYYNLLAEFSSSMQRLLILKRKRMGAMLTFVSGLQTLVDDQGSIYQSMRGLQGISKSELSNTEDHHIKEFGERVDNQLKDLISNVQAANEAINRKNGLVIELQDLKESIEQKNLKYKKEATTSIEVEEMRKEYDRLKKRTNEASTILLRELKSFHVEVDVQIKNFFTIINQRYKQYYADVKAMWEELQ